MRDYVNEPDNRESLVVFVVRSPECEFQAMGRLMVMKTLVHQDLVIIQAHRQRERREREREREKEREEEEEKRKKCTSHRSASACIVHYVLFVDEFDLLAMGGQ